MAAKKALKTSPTKQGSKKVGRPKTIATPEAMYELFEAYRADVKSKPFIVTDWVGAGAKQVDRTKEKPLTYEGFANYCFLQGIIYDTDDYFHNRGGAYNDFRAICAMIKRLIREDQIAGGMAGVYNPSITQRLNGLVEKTENKNEVTEIKIIRAK
jgi:hypothetical protein